MQVQYLSKVLIVVGVGVAAKLGAVYGESKQAHTLWQVNLGGLVRQHCDLAAGVRALQCCNEAGVRLCQLVVVMSLLQAQRQCQCYSANNLKPAEQICRACVPAGLSWIHTCGMDLAALATCLSRLQGRLF